MIGHLLKEQMDKKGMKANFICRQTGIHEGALSLILNNHANPTVDTIERIINVIGEPLTIPPTNGKATPKGA